MSHTPLDPEARLLTLLRQAGIEARTGSRSDLSLRLPDDTYLMVEVKSYVVPPPRRALKNDPTPKTRRKLYVLQRPSKHMTAEAISGHLDLVDITNQSVIITGREWHPEAPASDLPRSARPAWGRWAVLRSLYLAAEPLHQADIAQLSGVSQAAVSASIPHLRGVHRHPEGWVVNDREALASQWLNDYPGAGGLHSYWYALDAPSTVARDVRQLAIELEIGCLLSGDAAAQEYAPWRRPTSTQAYAEELIDFTVLGYSPASPEQSNLTVSLPKDPTVWTTATDRPGARDGLVDPLLAYWDLAHADGPDAAESANYLLGSIDNGRWLL